jgi:ditrans,polycis-polyprenyl diphosphate synthase
MIHGNL